MFLLGRVLYMFPMMTHDVVGVKNRTTLTLETPLFRPHPSLAPSPLARKSTPPRAGGEVLNARGDQPFVRSTLRLFLCRRRAFAAFG